MTTTTFGTLTRKGTTWHLDVQPHVLIRAKRLFGKVAKAAHGSLQLSDTPENAADLAWLLARYPVLMHQADRERLRAQALAHRAAVDVVQQILAGSYTPRDFALAEPARQYQRVAADLALLRRSLLLADDVGLGKTVSGIAMLTDPSTRPALVVTLTHLPRQWQAELARFAPGLTTHIVKGTRPYDLRIGVGMEKIPGQAAMFEPQLPDVILTSYSKLTGWADALAGVAKTVIFDEVQELRRSQSEKYSSAVAIAQRATYRLGLSATPIYNYGGEIHNVLSVLHGASLPTREEFIREWCNVAGGDDKVSIKNPAAFGTWLREAGLMLRRTRKDVGRELPGLTIVPHIVDTDTAALEQVSASARDLALTILAQGETSRGAKMQASEKLSNLLRQATGIAKAPYVAEFVRLLVESGEKVVLYGWHRSFYDIVCDKLGDLHPALYTGSESAAAKEAAKRRFVQGETNVLIISLRAGAGLDGLQHVCRTVVIGELDWSPGVHEQCIGRVNRDGQADPVVAYYLLADSGSDPVVSDVLGLKKAQAEGVRNPDRAVDDFEQVDPARIKRLAEAYLAQRGVAVPQEETA